MMLQVQLVRREKRGLELREAALRAQGPAHALLRDQLRWERAQLGVGGGDSSSEADSSEDEEWAQVRGPAWGTPPCTPAFCVPLGCRLLQEGLPDVL